MQKPVISSILLLSMLVLSSCSIGGSRTGLLNMSRDEKIADARMEEVIEALKNKDKDALKALFSQQALDEAGDIDSEIEHLLGFFQGEAYSWVNPSGPTVFESNNYGHRVKQINSYYLVDTDKQNYFFLLRDYPIDTDHPDNVGLYLLLVVRAEDEEKIYDGDQKILYDGDQKLSHAGIYLPLE